LFYLDLPSWDLLTSVPELSLVDDAKSEIRRAPQEGRHPTLPEGTPTEIKQKLVNEMAEHRRQLVALHDEAGELNGQIGGIPGIANDEAIKFPPLDVGAVRWMPPSALY